MGKKIIGMNLDEKYIKKGGRKAIEMTMGEFKKLVNNRLKQMKQLYLEEEEKNGYCSNVVYWHGEGWGPNGEDDEDEILCNLCLWDKQVEKDLSKVDFSNENISCDTKEWDWVGYGVINDLPCLKFRTGGDWEHPLYFIVYHDGKKFRGYIPTCGNTWNIKDKCAYGSEMDEDRENALADDLLAQGLKNIEFVDPNIELMEKDIVSRIEIVKK